MNGEQIKSAATTLLRATADRDRIAEALSALRAPATTEDIDRAIQEAAADQALAVDDALASEARSRLETLRAARTRAQDAARSDAALVAGLQSRLASADQAVDAARQALGEAEAGYLRSEIEAADQVYAAGAAKVCQALRRIDACKGLLRSRGEPVPPGPREEYRFEPAGGTSAALAQAANPGAPSGWHQRMFDRPDPAADRAALQRELASLASDQRIGVLARVRGALKPA